MNLSISSQGQLTLLEGTFVSLFSIFINVCVAIHEPGRITGSAQQNHSLHGVNWKTSQN